MRAGWLAFRPGGRRSCRHGVGFNILINKSDTDTNSAFQKKEDQQVVCCVPAKPRENMIDEAVTSGMPAEFCRRNVPSARPSDCDLIQFILSRGCGFLLNEGHQLRDDVGGVGGWIAQERPQIPYRQRRTRGERLETRIAAIGRAEH